MNKKFTVVIYLDHFTYRFPVLYYVKIENAKDMALKMITFNLDVSFNNLKEKFIKNDWQNNPPIRVSPAGMELVSQNEAFEIFLTRCNKIIDSHLKHMQPGACGEGEFNFECVEMTEEEFENPTGEIMSPYAYEFLEEGEEPKARKYAFVNPVTEKLMFNIKDNL